MLDSYQKSYFFFAKTTSGHKGMLDNEAEDPTFIKSIITGDETCDYEYDVETVQQSS